MNNKGFVVHAFTKFRELITARTLRVRYIEWYLSPTSDLSVEISEILIKEFERHIEKLQEILQLYEVIKKNKKVEQVFSTEDIASIHEHLYIFLDIYERYQERKTAFFDKKNHELLVV